MGRKQYINGGTPYLVTSGRPIYKHFTHTLKVNPNRMSNGLVENIIQIGVEEQNDMLDIIIIEPPQEVVSEWDMLIDAMVGTEEEQESEQEVTIHIEFVQEEVREPVQTRKIKVGNKIEIVPIETATITIL
mgnify:CR=1 FL=1